MAYRMGFEGMVVVSIKLTKAGKLLGRPRIVRSSGHRMLDKEAIRMILAAAPLPNMPSAFQKHHAEFRIPVNFTIQ